MGSHPAQWDRLPTKQTLLRMFIIILYVAQSYIYLYGPNINSAHAQTPKFVGIARPILYMYVLKTNSEKRFLWHTLHV